MIKAFVGHSFDSEDESIITAFKKTFDSFKKSMAFEWEDAEVTQIKPLSEKVLHSPECVIRRVILTVQMSRRLI